MLVLSRKLNERIQIGDDVEIVVVRLGTHVVRIGVTAPKEVQILRPDAVNHTKGIKDE